MKHKFLVLGCVVVVAGALALAVHSNNNYLARQAVVKAQSITRQVKQKLAQHEAAVKQQQEVNAEVSHLQTQCEVGVKDYSLLSSYQRLQGTIPVCSLQDAASVQ